MRSVYEMRPFFFSLIFLQKKSVILKLILLLVPEYSNKASFESPRCGWTEGCVPNIQKYCKNRRIQKVNKNT